MKILNAKIQKNAKKLNFLWNFELKNVALISKKTKMFEL